MSDQYIILLLAPASARRRPGFTLVELLIVCICVVLLLGPIYSIWRYGSRASVQGILRVDTTMEARRVMRQVHDDLKRACIELKGVYTELDFGTIAALTSDGNRDEYSFLRFPSHGRDEDAVPAVNTGLAWRRASRVTYTLEPVSPASPLPRRLTRRERYHPDHPLARQLPGGVETQVLSERVQYFALQPDRFAAGGRDVCGYWIILQLLETGGRGPAVLNGPATPGGRVRQAPPGTVIAEFADIAVPEYFHGLVYRDGFNVNWHTGVVGP